MALARQVSDESRHATLLYERLRELDGFKGEFPIANFEWGVTLMLEDLPGRLAVQNRTFEAGLIDILGTLRNRWREAGDDTTADMLEGILADEITHVRFANRWIKRLTEQDPRVLLKVAMAVRFPRPGQSAAGAEAGRRECGRRRVDRGAEAGPGGERRGSPRGGIHRRRDRRGAQAGRVPFDPAGWHRG